MPEAGRVGSFTLWHSARGSGRHDEVPVLDGVDGVHGKRVGVGPGRQREADEGGTARGSPGTQQVGVSLLVVGSISCPPAVSCHPGHVSLRPQCPEPPETPSGLAFAQCLATPSRPRRGSPGLFPRASAAGHRGQVCSAPGALVLS